MSRTSLVGLLVKAGLLLFTILAVRMCLPERTTLAPADPTTLERKLIILPTDGIPNAFLTTLRSRLVEQHRFEVLVAVQMALSPDLRLPTKDQLDAERTAARGRDLCRQMSSNGEYCIVLTNRDLNAPGSGLRFLFAQHQQGVSVVSLARLSDLNYVSRLDLLSVPVVFERTTERAVKMINKGLGLGYYGCALSSNRKSVMYAPIMSLADLDSVGIWYLKDEIRKQNY